MNKIFNLKESLVIRTNKIVSYTAGGLGCFCIVVSVIMLYSNSAVPDVMCKWLGIASAALGSFFLLIFFRTLITPLIIADNAGVTFNIDIFGRKIFVPWEGISEIGKEEMCLYADSGFNRRICLVIGIYNDYWKKFPFFLMFAHPKFKHPRYTDKISFPAGVLQMSIDDVVGNLKNKMLKSF